MSSMSTFSYLHSHSHSCLNRWEEKRGDGKPGNQGPIGVWKKWGRGWSECKWGRRQVHGSSEAPGSWSRGRLKGAIGDLRDWQKQKGGKGIGNKLLNEDVEGGMWRWTQDHREATLLEATWAEEEQGFGTGTGDPGCAQASRRGSR